MQKIIIFLQKHLILFKKDNIIAVSKVYGWEQMENINYVLFSEQNLVFAEKLRSEFRNIGGDVIYFNELGLLVSYVVQNKNTIIFIENKFNKYAHLLSELIKSEIFTGASIVFICEEKCVKKYINNRTVFCISEDFKVHDIINVIDAYRVVNGTPTEYDFSIVNTLLSNVMFEMGISVKLIGYNYIKECVRYAISNKFKLGALHKDVYKYVASLNNISVSNVERSIRNSIMNAKKKNLALLEKVGEGSSLTNKMVLAYIIEYINVEYGKIVGNNALKHAQ